MVRYYLGTCEYKWTHKNSQMEIIWVRREVGEEIFKTVETNGWDWVFLRSESQTMPGDLYCRCDIYVDIPNSKEATLFVLKYHTAKLVEKIL